MGTPTVSVIVPFCDARHYLAGCIKSLLDQTLSPDAYELIFIDNNSTDGGPAVVAAHPQIRLLRETRPGAYAARNRGLLEARGQVLAFTDPDCQVDRDFLERILAALSAPEVGIVLGHRVPPTDGGLIGLVAAYEAQKAAYVANRGAGELIFGHANSMAVKREVMERVGPFADLMRGGDTVLVRSAVDACGSGIVRYCPDIRVRHLEVDSLWSYYGKNRTYGKSNEQLRSVVPFRPLSTLQRLEVFRDTVREQGWSPLRGALLLAVLIPGMFCYEWGRLESKRRGEGDEHRADPDHL